ncbi:RNA polymerase sigma factor [Thalassovita mediterranea]|jgi:RNA polymerase sigma-70 factor (ECF subfamily)|uniref:Sigma-W factor n=1 Tax=Thalassovita mediterranea TaxID=340021 RepID=A0A0N7M1Q2_9RHOB|nr:RNA polymerase sigma factor [Thalassovita mediterranea]CUH83939.1 Sigma-W factor [Thalassovita mediterranea]SIS28071.1 RNA polymerase, sigma subunit, ECF family [Thalassovita mediterranea]
MDMALDTLSEIPDDALLVLFANGDAAAARALNLRLTPRVFAQAMRMLGNRAEAEDVAQDAMMRLWKIAPDWRQGEAKVTTWLYRVVANLCTDRLRRRPSVGIDAIPEPADDSASVADGMQDRARLDALYRALDTLPDRQRQAVTLRHIEGLANPEIAAIMDISTEAVESLTARGKRALAAALAGRREDLGYSDG